MQKVAAYILQPADDLQGLEGKRRESERLRTLIEAWLKNKGASSVDGTGTYTAVDGSDAKYEVTTATDGERSWRMFELSEVTPEGRKFVTSVSLTVGHRNVVVFVTMEVGSVATSITRIEVDPRCPNVVRDLLALPGAWFHGESRLRILTQVNGFDAGETLALELQNKDRTIPFVVVSRVLGMTALPKLDEKLAHDLAGVANVYSVDEDASWALTDVLRKPLSTYAGAIRIYWPRLTSGDAPFRHQLWTATRLKDIDAEPKGALERIRRQVRRIVMSASAASVVRPNEIDDIRGAAARSEYAALQAKASALEELKSKASSLAEFKDIADSYAAENDELQRELAARATELQRLRDEVKRLEADKQGLIYQLGQVKGPSDGAIEVEPDAPEQDEADQPPAAGELRFYKKTHSKPAYDVLVQTGDCGHNAWQGSAKADKARKGLARLLGNHREWKSLQHCGSCTGGGMWRVQW